MSQKQISLFLPLEDWKKMRMEAARQKIPLTELARKWLQPKIKKLK